MINLEDIDLLCNSAAVIGKLGVVCNHSTKGDDLGVLVDLHNRFKERLLQDQASREPVIVMNNPLAETLEPTHELQEEHHDPDHGFVESVKVEEQLPAVRTMVFEPEKKEAAQAEGMKLCTRCKSPKPATDKYFRFTRGKLHSWCHDCEREKSREYQQRRAAGKKEEPTAAKPEPAPKAEPQSNDTADKHQVVYVDQNNAIFYIDEILADDSTRYTLWKHKKPAEPMCLASLLDEYSGDGTFPTRDLAQAALDQFARTQRQWRRGRRKMFQSEATANG